MSNIVKVLLFSALSYATLFVISKLLGKKQLAELDFIDYVTGISIGSIAAEMATETDKPFYHYLIRHCSYAYRTNLQPHEAVFARRADNID